MRKRGMLFGIVCAAVLVPAFSGSALALDPPHDTANLPDGCSTCHSSHGAQYPVLLGELCQSCHFAGGPAPEVKTHSSLTTDNGYGNWHVRCWGCHNPHTQEQDNYWGSTYGMFIRRDLQDVIEVDPADPGPYYESLGIFRAVVSNIAFLGPSGPDSFVDSDASTDDDICRVCHQSTGYYRNDPPAPEFTGHPDYGTTDTQPGGACTTCHHHDDGFAASGGGCTGCHASAQPSGSEYRRQVAGTGGDFERTSHHVTDGSTTEIVTDDDCGICHDQSNHQSNTDPEVLLNDPDGGSSHTYTGTGASLESFCLNCHDADGYGAAPGTPFPSDGRTPPDVATSWTGSLHDTSLTSEACMSCHGGYDSTQSSATYGRNAHGSCEPSLVSARVDGEFHPAEADVVTIADSVARGDVYQIVINGTTVGDYTAARGDTPAMVRDDLVSDINSSSEPVTATAKGSGTLIIRDDNECETASVSLAGSGQMTLLSDATSTAGACFACHDGAPASTNIEAQFSGMREWTSNSGALLNMHHDVTVGDFGYSGAQMACTDCHDAHAALLLADPDPTDGTTPAAGNSWTGSTLISELCLDCHDNTFPPTITPPGNPLVDISSTYQNDDQHGVPVSGIDASNLAGSWALGDIVPCEACHNLGHGETDGTGTTYPNLANLRAFPLDADGTPLPGGPVRLLDPDSALTSENGKDWCSRCHPLAMGNKDVGCLAGNCHNHGAGSF